jgi:hypothetical protein
MRAFEDRAPEPIFGPKKEEIIRSWRKLRNGDLHSLYFSQNITRMVKSRRINGQGM